MKVEDPATEEQCHDNPSLVEDFPGLPASLVQIFRQLQKEPTARTFKLHGTTGSRAQGQRHLSSSGKPRQSCSPLLPRWVGQTPMRTKRDALRKDFGELSHSLARAPLTRRRVLRPDLLSDPDRPDRRLANAKRPQDHRETGHAACCVSVLLKASLWWNFLAQAWSRRGTGRIFHPCL